MIIVYDKKALFFDKLYVNGKKINHKHILKHNDMIDVVFSESKRPIRVEWFNILRTLEAKESSIQSLGGDETYKNLMKGYENKFCFYQKGCELPPLSFIYENYEKNLSSFRYNSFEKALIALGENQLDIHDFLKKLLPPSRFNKIKKFFTYKIIT